MWNRCCWCYCNRDWETTGCTSGCTTTCAFSSARLSPPYSLFTVWGVIQLNIWMTKKAKWTHHAAGIKRKKMRGGHSSRKSLFRWLSSYRPSDSTNNVSVRYRFLSTPGVGRVGSLFYRLDCLSTRCCSSAKMSLHHSAPRKTHTNRPTSCCCCCLFHWQPPFLVTGLNQPASAILNCLLAHQLCAEDPSCKSIETVIQHICGPATGKCFFLWTLIA